MEERESKRGNIWLWLLVFVPGSILFGIAFLYPDDYLCLLAYAFFVTLVLMLIIIVLIFNLKEERKLREQLLQEEQEGREGGDVRWKL